MNWLLRWWRRVFRPAKTIGNGTVNLRDYTNTKAMKLTKEIFHAN